MIVQFFAMLHRWLAPPAPAVELPADVPVGDGRIFCWIRVRGGVRATVNAVILRDKTIGQKLEFIPGTERVLLPSEYDDDLESLIKRYPAPDIKPESLT